MRRLLAILAASAALAAAADAKGPADDWAGVYKRQFQNGTVEGEKYQSEDIMEIVRVDETHAYVRLALEFYNGHSCSFAEVMQAEAGKLAYHARPDADAPMCNLSVVREGDAAAAKFKFEDKDGQCQAYYCGARGSFEGSSFPVSAKRTIRYMDRLKASREYKDALKHAGITAAQ